MIYQVYWRHKDHRMTHTGLVKANSHDQAYDIAMSMLQPGNVITAVYKATEDSITPQSITLNFQNTADYSLF